MKTLAKNPPLVSQGRVSSFCTVKDWFYFWVDTRKTHSTMDDVCRFRVHIEPIIGERQMASITKSDIEHIVRSLDAKIESGDLSAKTAANVWSLVRTMFSAATNGKATELRTHLANISEGVLGPDSGATRVKQYLTPSEFLQVMQCESVSVDFRHLIAFAVYTGMRAGEISEFRGSDIHEGIITVARSVERAPHRYQGTVSSPKNGTGRRFLLRNELVGVVSSKIASKGISEPLWRVELTAASMLRDALKKAGITRRELFEDTATSKSLTFHDLRATHITWSVINREDPLAIMYRVGHSNYATFLKYVREAESLRAGFGQVFPKF